MPKQSIYIDRDDAKRVEAEERNKFIYGVLVAIGIPLEDIWDIPEESLTVEKKIEYRKLLQKFNITILDIGNNDVEIYVDKDLIAKWKKPKYILRTDASKIDPSKKLFYEMIIEYENIFEENESS